MTQPELDLKGREPRELLIEIRGLIEEARRQTAIAVNIGLTVLYWRVGKRIHLEVLGSERAAYGEPIVATLSRQLVAEYGRGYTEKNLRRMIQFAEAFPEEEIEAGYTDGVRAERAPAGNSDGELADPRATLSQNRRRS